MPKRVVDLSTSAVKKPKVAGRQAVGGTGDLSPSITPEDTAFAAGTDIISRYIQVARASEAGIIADRDTEFLHDYRVALRKIRSVLSLFKGVYAQKQIVDLKIRFSDLMAPTGRLRDLDVYLLEKQRYYGLLPKSLHGGLDRMFVMFIEERKIEKAKLASHLQSKDYEKEISGLARLFDKRKKLHRGQSANLRVHDFACALIWKHYRRIRSFSARIGPDTDDAEVHTLRIHCKKLRYLMEFFAPRFPKPEFKALLTPLKLLQDNLGLFNDYAVQQRSLHHFIGTAQNWPDAVRLEVAQSVDALIEVLHSGQLEERVKIVQTFAHFNNPSMRTSFRDQFHAGKTKT